MRVAEFKRRFAMAVAVLITISSTALAQQKGDGLKDYLGPRFAPGTTASPPARSNHSGNAAETVRHWNQVAIDASGLDHTPVAGGDPRIFGEQLGPARASRAMAIVHIAMFEAANAIGGNCQSYIGMRHVHGKMSMDAALGQAAHDTLVELFTSQRAACDQILADQLAHIVSSREKIEGIDLGHRAAVAILALRANDGSLQKEPRLGVGFFPSDQPGRWRQDPISKSPIALGAYWSAVQPFVLKSAAQFRVPNPPALNSPEYTAAYNEVKAVGGDGVNTPTIRTDEQSEIGVFWAYDGTPSLCAPPRLYNQIAMQIAVQRGTASDPVELARLLALVNVAMADAGIAVWESKYFHQFWRPVTGIRESDPGTGPTGAGDSNLATAGDVNFSPLGAPASNLSGPNFTPPFPAYPSGHAGFGGALFQTLRNFYGTDAIPFTFVSDEFNGTTRDHDGKLRPLKLRSFQTLSEAEEENGQSRIYLGIHWSFDKTAGIAQGRQVADYVFTHAFRPAKHGGHDRDRE